MADEGFHEIQLSKKQLFFLFMAAALFSVVVFSLGVWVGQDVRRPESEITAENTPDSPADTTPEPTKVAPSELDYAARLQSDNKAPAATAAPPETKPIEPPSPPDTEVVPQPVAAPPEKKVAPETKAAPPETKAAPPAKSAASKAAPKSGGLMLQVGAFNDAATAQSLVTRLKAKGYAAFVFTAPSGPLRNKVRVGPLADRAEADRVSARLKKEEGFSPFITR